MRQIIRLESKYKHLLSCLAISCGILVSVFGILQTPAKAQLVQYGFPVGQNALIPTSITVSGLTATPVVRGSGLTAPPYTGEIFTSGGFPTTYPLATAISQNDYIGFTITNTIPSEQTILISGMALECASPNGGPQDIFLESSMYGFTDTSVLTLIQPNSGGMVFIGSHLAVLNAASPSVEIRFYGTNATNSSGLFAIKASTAIGLFGTVSPAASAPEPDTIATFAFFAPLGLLALNLRRRR